MDNETERRSSKRDQVLDRLTTGPALNTELNAICFRYGARIKELRAAGVQITTEALGAGVFRYALG